MLKARPFLPGFLCKLITRSLIVLQLLMVLPRSVAAQPVQCGNSASADIVIMLDLTGSSGTSDITVERNAAKALLNFFNTAAIKPYVAIGSFNSVGCQLNSCSVNCTGVDQARILASFTNSYGTDGAPGTGLFAAINGVPNSGSGGTNIGLAIDTSAAELIQVADAIPGGASRDNYIVLISDGDPNIPGFDSSSFCPGTCTNCTCPEAEGVGAASATAAKLAGTKIFAIHYQGGGSDSCLYEGGFPSGYLYMRDSIASSPSYFYQGNADLSGVLTEISQAITCDDGLDCTLDSCNTQNGLCQFTELDSDNDNVPDCGDLCQGNNSLVGQPCDGGDPDDCASGSYTCASGTLTCSDGPAIDDADGDGTPDCHDDCANDPTKTTGGICGCGIADTDSDGDGTPNCNDTCPNDPLKTTPGACGCGNPDTDSDGDGAPNCTDLCPNDPLKVSAGACGCGTADTDSDGDGTPDCTDQCKDDPTKTQPGACGCGVADTDTDGDGTPDCNDQCVNDPNKTTPGVCGCGTSDADRDSDGTPDCNDQCVSDPNKTTPGACGCGVSDADTDGDGTPDCNDQCVSDPTKTAPGLCGCGTADTDTDGDGTPNCQDQCVSDPDKTTPGACGCGVSDADTDGDGSPNCNDQCLNDPLKSTPGLCGCGVSDVDSDGDQNPDCTDQCPSDPNKTSGGICGCGVADVDTDGDGSFNCADSCPSDPNKTSPGQCGCDSPDIDSDQDGILDCFDECPGSNDGELGTACSTGLGVCQKPGVVACSDGGLYCETSEDQRETVSAVSLETEASEEICDGLDNDCDGQTDEDLDCNPVPTPTPTATVIPEPTINPEVADCAGTPGGSAKIDRCGVCNGDGNSCLGCTSKDISPLLFALDGGTLSQKQNINAAVKRFLSVAGKTKANLAKAQDIRKRADSLYLQSWNLVWSVPQSSVSCTNAQFCVQSDNSGSITNYNSATASLDKITGEVLSLIKKARGGRLTASDKKFSKRSSDLLAENLAISAQVPTSQSVCS